MDAVRRLGARVVSPLLMVVDLFGAACLLLVLAGWIALRATFTRRRREAPATRTLVVLDMSYTLEDVRKRQLDEPITARDLEGFFDHVWSVHPSATVIAPADPRQTWGPSVVTPYAERHTIIEGKVGRFRLLRRAQATNFLIAQLALLNELYTLIRRRRVSAVRAGDPYYLGLLGLILSITSGIPYVVRIPANYDTFYERVGHLAYPRLFRRRSIEQAVSRLVLTRADLVAGSNQDSLDFALANGARRQHSTLFRVGNLIHKAHFQPPDHRPDATPILRELGLEGKTFSMTMCRFEPMKQVDDVLRVLAAVRSAGVDLYALLVGDGRLREQLHALARSLGVADKVVFAGNRPQEWIAAVLPRAAVVLSPHMGRGLTEALLSGSAAVAYDVEWQGEVVIAGRTGELVEDRNWQQMAQAACRLCTDGEYAGRLGANGRAFILEMMDPARLTQHERDEYIKLFDRLAPQRAPEPSSL